MSYLAILRLELVEGVRQPRGAVIAVVALLFFLVAFVQGAARVAGDAEAIQAAVAENRQAWLAQPAMNPHGAAHFAMLLAKPPAPLGGLVLGVEGSLAGHVYTDAHRLVPASGGRAADLPFAEAIGPLDVAFVVGVVLPLFAVLLGADLVAGEKERGTLRLVFANPVGRGRWLGIRLLGRTCVFLGTVALAAFVAWGLAGMPPIGEAGRLAAFAGLSGLYLAAWVAIGAACSAFATRLASASLAAIALWIGLVIVAPRVMASVAELGDPPPLTSPARMDLRIADVKLRREQQKLVADLKAKGALKNATATAAVEGPAAVREKIDAEAARARAKADAPAEEWRAKQLARLDALAPLSPAALYFQAASGLAGTDGARHAAFLAQALAWRQAFLGKLNGLEDAHVKEFKAYDQVAPFAFAEIPAGEALAAQGLRLAGLLGFALFAAFLALWRFRRYDLR